MRLPIVMVLCALLTGCGMARQADQQEAAEEIPDGWKDALAECRHASPDQKAQAVARAACVIRATELLRPMLPFPDLLDQENALRKSLAEQVQSGRISLIERNRQITKFHSNALVEEQTRLQANPDPKVSAGATQWR